MRLFVAIPLPERVKARLEALQEPIRGVRWQNPDQYHLTLRFIGEVSDRLGKEITGRLQEIEYSAFRMNIGRLGCFPKRGAPRVIWVGIEQNSRLIRLQEKIESICRSVGIDPETRPFHAHITLARTNGKGDPQEQKAFIARESGIEIRDIPVTRFILYQSELQPGGAVHTAHRIYNLNQ